MSDDEFEALLDSLHTGASTPAAAAPVAAVATTGESGHGTTPLLANAGKPASEGALAVRTAHAPVADTTIRVDTGRLDVLVNLIGELVLVRNRLAVLSAASSDECTERAVAELHRVADDLQLAVMRTRMLPIGKLFSRFPRIVRDPSRQLGQQIDLVLERSEEH